MLYFKDEGQRAVGNGLHEVYRHGTVVSAFDTSQCFLKVSAEACSVLAGCGRPC